MDKIKNVSLFFRLLFQAMFIIYPIIIIVLWAKAPAPFIVGSSKIGFAMNIVPRNIPIINGITTTTKIYGFLITLIPTAIIEITLFFLIKLFRLYEKTEFFAIENVRYIKYIGYSILVGQILNPFHQALLTGVLTWNNPQDQRYAILNFDGMNIALILMALLIILISWIMAEGVKLQEEQKYIV